MARPLARARNDRKFLKRFSLDGNSLKRPPRGFPADHPWIDDLKRTDFIGLEELDERDVLGTGFLEHVAASFTASRPFMRFLCDALKDSLLTGAGRRGQVHVFGQGLFVQIRLIGRKMDSPPP